MNAFFASWCLKALLCGLLPASVVGQVGELCVDVILYPLQEEGRGGECLWVLSFLFASFFPSLTPDIRFSDCCILHSQEKYLHFSQHLASVNGHVAFYFSAVP